MDSCTTSRFIPRVVCCVLDNRDGAQWISMSLCTPLISMVTSIRPGSRAIDRGS